MLVSDKSLTLDFRAIPSFLKISTLPTVEPVEVAELKPHARVDIDLEDPLLARYLQAAREMVEADCRRALITQTWKLYMDRFPRWEIELQKPPIQSVSSIQYLDTAGVLQTLSSSLYQVDTTSEPGIISPVFGQIFPVAKYRTKNAVTVTFTAGYGAASSAVPQLARQAILMLAAFWYQQREMAISGNVPAIEPPMAYQACIQRLKWGDHA